MFAYDGHHRRGSFLRKRVLWVGFAQTDNARVCVHFENDRMGVCQCAVNL